MKEPLILVPGLLCDERLWGPQVAELGDVCKVTVADVSHDDSVDGMARRILASAPERFALAGLSMGGYVSLELMRRSPERVSRLALLDTSARPDTEEQTRLRLTLVKKAKSEGLESVARELLPRLLHAESLERDEIVSLVVEMAEGTGIEAFERQERAIIARPDGRSDLRSIPCPTLVLCGNEDLITPPESHEELASGIPNASLQVVERCGHLSTLERPETVTSALQEWLS